MELRDTFAFHVRPQSQPMSPLAKVRAVTGAIVGATVMSACTSSGRPAASTGDTRPASSLAAEATPAACGTATPTVTRRDEAAETPVATFDTAWSIIRRTHWDTTYNGVNWLALRDELRPRAAAARTRGELRAVLSDMVGRLRQSHFAVIPQELADGVSGGNGSGEPTRGGGGWVGVTYRYLDGAMVLTAVDSGGPAWRAGARAGWTLEAIGGCPLSGRLTGLRLTGNADQRQVALSAYQTTTRLLDAAPGDTLSVTFRAPDGRRLSPTLTLGEPPGVITKFGNLPPMVAHLTWHRVRQDGRTIGVIRFNTWMPVLSSLFDATIDSLRTADAIVLDVRGNLGGVGGMSMGVAGHFVDTVLALGTMHQRGVTLRMVTNPRRVDTRAQPVRPFAGPLAIVVDELSASTTEIFAGGLQALGRATVFGSQTAGQALPSVPERLPNGDILYHAIADFIGASGRPVEGDGVRPDHVTPPTVRALVEGQDPALQAALIWAARQTGRPPVP